MTKYRVSTIIKLSLNIILFCSYSFSTTSHFEKRLAIATQGSSELMRKWIKTSQNYTNNESHFFFLSFNKPIGHNYCMSNSVTCIFQPNTTWTSGRNSLIKSIYEFEINNDIHFKYWSFYDGDALFIKCHASFLKCGGEFWCCLNIYADWLLDDRHNFALVSTVAWFPLSNMPAKLRLATVYHHDCPDAAFNVFHRRAVPALLPYVELLDARSWWYSQAFLFSLIVGCVRGYSVTLELLESFRQGNLHSNYPREDINVTVINATMTRLFTKIGISPYPVTLDSIFGQGNCANILPRVDFIGSNVSEEMTRTKSWMYSERFKACLSVMRPRFQTFVTGGRIDII